MLQPNQGPRPGRQQNSYEANRSMMNPTDVASMASRGKLRPDMTVRELFSQFGVDVDGPVAQLDVFKQKTIENADPIKKMQNIAGQPGQAPQGQPAPMGLEQLARM